MKLSKLISFSYIVVSIVIILILGIAMNTFFINDIFKGYITGVQEEKINTITEDIEKNYEEKPTGWKNDIISYIGMDALKNNIFINIKDNNGEVIFDIFEHNYMECCNVIDEIESNIENNIYNEKNKYIEENRELKFGDDYIGTLTIGYYIDYYDELETSILRQINIALIILSVIAIGFSIIFANVLSKKITRPILSVINATEHISKGKFSESISTTSKTKEISKLIQSVNTMAKSIEDADKKQKQLTTDVAHELRTPVTTISTHLEALIDGVWDLNKERLISIHEEVLRLNNLIDDLKKVCEIDDNQLICMKSNIDFNSFINSIFLNFQPYFSIKDIEFKLENNIDNFVYIDEEKLTHILVNLLQNAQRYTDVNGVVILRCNVFDNILEIKIIDNGVGISDEDLPYIFDRFYRVDKSRNNDTGGSGIGLTIVKKLIDICDGEIYIETKEKIGSIFTIRIPSIEE